MSHHNNLGEWSSANCRDVSPVWTQEDGGLEWKGRVGKEGRAWGGKWSKLSVNEEETEHGTQQCGNELNNEPNFLFWTFLHWNSHQGPGSRFGLHLHLTLISLAGLCTYNPLANQTLDRVAATKGSSYAWRGRMERKWLANPGPPTPPHSTPTLFPEDVSYADVRFSPLPLAFNRCMWWELIRDCFNADVIFRRFAFLWSIKSEKWEDEREALGFMRDGNIALLYFTTVFKVQWWLCGFTMAFQHCKRRERTCLHISHISFQIRFHLHALLVQVSAHVVTRDRILVE